MMFRAKRGRNNTYPICTCRFSMPATVIGWVAKIETQGHTLTPSFTETRILAGLISPCTTCRPCKYSSPFRICCKWAQAPACVIELLDHFNHTQMQTLMRTHMRPHAGPCCSLGRFASRSRGTARTWTTATPGCPPGRTPEAPSGWWGTVQCQGEGTPKTKCSGNQPERAGRAAPSARYRTMCGWRSSRSSCTSRSRDSTSRSAPPRGTCLTAIREPSATLRPRGGLAVETRNAKERPMVKEGAKQVCG